MNAIIEAPERAVVASGPMANAIAALQAGMTIESLRGIMDLQKEWESNEARKAYVSDMAAFKLNPPEIYKTKRVAFAGTEYMHATIGDVAKAIVDALARHGFSHSWETKQDDGLITVNCKITHRMGHSESTSMQSAPDQSGKKNAIQAVASSITYMQRYTLLAACGLATMDMTDDDGQGGGQAPVDYIPEVALATWTKRVDEAIDIDSLRVSRGLAAEEFKAAGDVKSWNALKAHIANRRAALDGAAA